MDALPQRIRSCLSLRRKELIFHPEFGTRLADYYREFRTSPWLARLLKLEVVRQAAIPYYDASLKVRYTPLQCVDRVSEVTVLSEELEEERPLIRVCLDFRGVGLWQCDVAI